MDVLSIISLYFIISSVLLGVLDGCRSIQDIQAGTKNLQTPFLLRNSRFVLSQPSCWKPQQFEGFESSSMIYLILPLTQDTPENKCNLLEFSDTSRASQSHPQVIPSSLGQNFISKLLSERFEVVFLWPCPDRGTQSQMFLHFKSFSDFALIF